MNRWPREVNEAIWTLHKAGKSIAEITAAINAGETELRLARPIPYETVRAKRRRLILERGDGMSKPLHTESPEETAQIIRNEFLMLARAKANQIRAATVSRTIKPDEAKALDQLTRVIERLTAKPASQSAQAKAARAKGSNTSPRSLLARLADAEREARSSSQVVEQTQKGEAPRSSGNGDEA